MHRKESFADDYYFHTGTACRAYEYMGCHAYGNKYIFKVWAPNADEAYVLGDFNNWSDEHKMQRTTRAGLWEIAIDRDIVSEGSRYKYKFINSGKVVYKSDPYGVKMEAPPTAASIICDIDGYKWNDKGWLNLRKRLFDGRAYDQPMNVYEIHMGSWKRHDNGEYYTYAELADELAPYVKQMGYTHIELMPIAEHPFDGSWGYQVCGYYAPTRRYGTPKEFMEFVDSMHQAGIGVILDWVPAHFPKDEFGLYEFDGQPLYEYQGFDRQEHKIWGTRKFDLGREEVQSFLISNAMYWADKYHIDGLRVDAVSSMIYLDFDKDPGEWLPNVYGDNRCLEAIAFFKKLNGTMKREYPDVLMIAEESSAWDGITSFEGENGLGFDMKWNMGWMNDTLRYMKEDPIYRRYHHEKLTFPLCYAFNERYVLPISHDEVVHGKKSFLDKNPGDYWNKFAGARVFYAWQMTHPGKKLHFMSNEIAQFAEWNHDKGVEWFMLDYDMHAKFQLYCSELNNLYLKYPELWQVDSSWDGFNWIDVNNKEQSIIAFERIDANGRKLQVILNFTPNPCEDYYLGLGDAGTYEEIFNSDDERFGGSGVTNKGVKFKTELGEDFGHPYFIRMRIPPMGASIMRCTRKAPKNKNNK